MSICVVTAQQYPIEDTLNSLITACEHSVRNFLAAKQHISNDMLETLFRNYAQQRAQFIIALRAEVRCHGGKPALGSDMVGLMLRGWMNLKTALKVKGANDKELINQCMRAEEEVLDTYHTTIQNTELPADVVMLINRQFEEINQVYNNIRLIVNEGDVV